jgi:hypothetical protein
MTSDDRLEWHRRAIHVTTGPRSDSPLPHVEEGPCWCRPRVFDDLTYEMPMVVHHGVEGE